MAQVIDRTQVFQRKLDNRAAERAREELQPAWFASALTRGDFEQAVRDHAQMNALEQELSRLRSLK